MAGWISPLNPNAPEFFPLQNPQLLIPCPSLSTPHHYYLSSPNTNFYYCTPYVQSFSKSETFYTNFYLQSTEPSLLLPPSQHKNLLTVTEPTNSFVAEPLEQTHVVHHETKVEQKVVTQKVHHKRYRNRCYGGQGGGRVRQPWRAKCGNSTETSSPNENVNNRRAGNAETLNKFARKAGFCVKAKKRNYTPVLPVQSGAVETTVMIRNIPNKYNREMLVEFLDHHCMLANREKTDKFENPIVSEYDFLYLPIDFSTGFNKGYAFVNFTNPQAVWKFYIATDEQSWDHFNSHKKRQIALARIQGKEELVRHFESVGFPCESDQVLPVLFEPPRDGSRKLVKQSIVGKCTRMGVY